MATTTSRVLEGVEGFGPLREWMRADGITQKALAAAVGVSQQSVSAWMKGSTRPDGDHLRIKIELLSNGRVNRSLWLNTAERLPLPVVVEPISKTGTEET